MAKPIKTYTTKKNYEEFVVPGIGTFGIKKDQELQVFADNEIRRVPRASTKATPDNAEAPPNFEKMNKDELVTYAGRHNLAIAKSWTKTKIIHAIRERLTD